MKISRKRVVRVKTVSQGIKKTTQLSRAKRLKKFQRAVEVARKSGVKQQYKDDLQKDLGATAVSYIQKLNDDPGVVPGARIDKYWRRKMITLVAHNYFDHNRILNLKNPFDAMSISKKFHLRGIQYGNWLNQEDRYNYLFALALSLDDLKKITGVTYKRIGFSGKLTIGLGARGMGGAAAHFEPSTGAINLTRYPDKKKKYEGYHRAITKSGGAGALAHEWGHALDFFLGNGKYISGGRSVRWKPDPTLMKEASAKGAMERLLARINTNPNGSKSQWRTQMDAFLKRRKKMGDYYVRRTEIFARLFESYCALMLARSGGKNAFISEMKYEKGVYFGQNGVAKVKRQMDDLMRYARV